MIDPNKLTPIIKLDNALNIIYYYTEFNIILGIFIDSLRGEHEEKR